VKQRIRAFLLLLLPVCAVSGAAEIIVPLMSKAPVIDGQIGPKEWRVSVGFDGFQWGGKLARRRVKGFVGATDNHIYVAIQSQMPDEGALKAEIATDSLKAVHDDAVEVFVCPTPDAEDRVDYQCLVNSLGKGGYNVHFLGKPDEAVSWRGGWQQSHGVHDGWWHFECAIPISGMKTVAAGRRTTDGVWTINLTRDWKNPWAWSSLEGKYNNSGLRFRFVKTGAPAVTYRADGDPFLTNFNATVVLHNPGVAALPLKTTLLLDRNLMPALRKESVLTLAPGGTQEVVLPVPQDDSTTRFGLTATVGATDGKTTFHQREVKWPKGEAYAWVVGAEKKRLPIDFQFAYYPYGNRLRIVADVRGLPKEAALEALQAVVSARLTRETIKAVSFDVAAFRDGQQEQVVDLPPLDGLYEISLQARGAGVPEGKTVKHFERKVFPWEQTPVGRSRKVYPPFTPIEVSGSTLKTVLREHTLNDSGLLDQIKAASAHTGVTKSILAAPMRYEASIAGEAVPLTAEALRFEETSVDRAVVAGRIAGRGLQTGFTGTWDVDGTLRVDLTLQPTEGKVLDKLELVIPFRPESATLIHANADRIRAPVAQRVPAGEGTVWRGSEVASDDMPPNFCPYVFLGSPVRGLCWFAENDRGWSWDPGTPNLDVSRENGQVVLRVHLVNKPLVITEPRTITFGLLAAPVKPRLVAPGQGKHWWRYRYLRDKYTLLGTDVNWLSIGTCGSFYPAGKDLYLWEMLRKGNEQKLSRETIKAVTDWGRKYYEPFGEARVETWVRHARHNLQSRYGKKMVFYYNRASHQGCEEFETFKDEWNLTDLRSIGKGKGLGEIKVVPSASYIDYNLYWYGRSFEVGGNQGVYWDNWFLRPSFNTEMTAAYRRDDGTIMPSTGIWELRELSKRTFLYLNERGMLPIVFPHMTSFNPLPMMAFSTVQYDWEWKYSQGNVQNRHSRELIQLMGTGEHAGVWPVPLSDHGNKADDPWTQRTFSAVRLVHELDGYGGFGNLWQKSHKRCRTLAQPVLDLLDNPKLQVFRYWDERDQPVRSEHPEVLSIVYAVPGKEAVVVVTSYAREDVIASLRVDAAGLGLPAGFGVVNLETGHALSVTGSRFELPLKLHDMAVLRLSPGE